MFRPLDTPKALQAIGVLLRSEPLHAMGKLRVLKLLYIADRELLAETGRSLLGARVVALKLGPLHSDVYDLIKGQHVDEPLFAKHFELLGYKVHQKDDPGVMELSRLEIAKLQELSHRYADLDDVEITQDITHDFPEWQKNYRENASTAIPLADILTAVGREEDKDEIIADEERRARFARVFAPQS